MKTLFLLIGSALLSSASCAQKHLSYIPTQQIIRPGQTIGVESIPAEFTVPSVPDTTVMYTRIVNGKSILAVQHVAKGNPWKTFANGKACSNYVILYSRVTNAILLFQRIKDAWVYKGDGSAMLTSITPTTKAALPPAVMNMLATAD